MRPRTLSWIAGLLALAGAGAYVFIYLYRWEWNRAIMAGVLFLAAEIGVVAALILSRLKSIEDRIKERPPRDSFSEALQDIKDAAPEPRRHFAWMSDTDKLGVFVPVLMGAGVVISGIAWAVEKIAFSTARPILERRLLARLAPISLPAGGLTGTSAVGAPPAAETKTAVIKRIVVLLLTVVAFYAGIAALENLTKNRPDAITGGSTTMELEISLRHEGVGSTGLAAESLWATCIWTVASTLTDITVSSRTATLTVEPALGKYSTRRLNGCLQDATIDGLQARVLN
jgi:hypothetical protein